MVLFSELAAFWARLNQFLHCPPKMKTLEVFTAAARKHRGLADPGSMFLKNPRTGRVYNTAVGGSTPRRDASAVTLQMFRVPALLKVSGIRQGN